MIDRKFEPLVKREMTKYLGELEDDDLVMFVLEHLKDHKTPQRLIEGLEPVRTPCFYRHQPSILTPRHRYAGFRRRGRRAHDQCLATSYIRKYGLR